MLGRLRLEVIKDDGSETLYDFIKRNVEPGSVIISDAWTGCSGIEPEIYTHHSVSQAAQKRAGGNPSAVPGVDRVISNLKTWLRGTHHGVGADHLDVYLNEFVFRFNRRYYPMAGFVTLPASEPSKRRRVATRSSRPSRPTGRRDGVGERPDSPACGSGTRHCLSRRLLTLTLMGSR